MNQEYPRVREIVRTTGTGSMSLDIGAVDGYLRIGQQYNHNDTFHYRIVHQTEDEWEEGTGTFDDTNKLLARTTVTASSNSGNKVSFSPGYKHVIATQRIVLPTYASDPSGTIEGQLVNVNGTLKYNDGSSLTAISGGGGGTSEPSGVIKMYGGSSAPTGYLLCDGSAVSRTTYATLFTAIGTTFGAGDGSTTFTLPDLRATFPVGAQAGGDYDLGDTGGSETVTLTEGQLPAHNHAFVGADAAEFAEVSLNGNFISAYDYTASAPVVNSVGSVTANDAAIGDTGSGEAHENRPPFLALNFIIKT